MADFNTRTYTKKEAVTWPTPNYWDFIALSLILAIIILLALGAGQMAAPYNLGQPIPISLKPSHLPFYALRTVLRMFIALFFSMLFTFIVGAAAAKSKRAERIIIPFIDIMQSAPVLSFLAITAPGFIMLFQGSMLGPECAAIFAIFTSQVWNITLSFYQSLRTVPKDLREVATIYQLSPWRKFWRVEVPFAMPGLLWNMMMSMSGSWFFVTASEAISVSHQTITLPGIGSYIALAISYADKTAILYAIIAMFIVIFCYDQLLFRPLAQWSQKFKAEEILDEKSGRSWLMTLFLRSHLLRYSGKIFTTFFDAIVNLAIFNPKPNYKKPNIILKRSITITLDIVVSAIILFTIFIIIRFLIHNVTWYDIEYTSYLGVITALRVIILIILSSLIWVPIGVYIGFNARISAIIQPIVQFLAAFPANLLFPIVAMIIVKYNLSTNIWTSPLMILGTQWYILFNVIAGASTIPDELRQTAATFGVKGWLWWKRLVLPGIFPFYVTGAITAAGGAWNASIIAEAVSWGKTHLQATGLGAYITHSSLLGSFPHLALGTIMMCLFVLVINRILWRPLYNLTSKRFKVE